MDDADRDTLALLAEVRAASLVNLSRLASLVLTLEDALRDMPPPRPQITVDTKGRL